MSRDYAKVVLATYEKKKIEGELSPNLLNPTPGNIREECLSIYGKVDRERDDEVLRLFFGYSGSNANYLQILENSPAQKFKQMPNILKGNVPRPGLKYVELLAWLIDFSPRPITSYSLDLNRSKEKMAVQSNMKKLDEEVVNENKIDNYKENDISEDFKKIQQEMGGNIEQRNSSKKDNAENHDKGRKPNEKKGEKNPDKFFLLKKWGFRIGAVIILVGFLLFPRYMTWEEDHYEWLIFKTKKTPVIAIDWEMVRDFRMVTRKDTLTEYSVGKFWYLKENNNHDVFTMGGKHPVLANRYLRPLSKTILDSIRSKIRIKNPN